MKGFGRTFWAACACVVALAAPVRAQVQSGSITGAVSDASGAVLPGVTVSLASDKLIGGVQVQVSDGSGNYLAYELYQDSSRSAVWASSGSGLLSPVEAPSKVARDFTVYGRIDGNQDIPAGSYADSVVATVNF